MRNEEFNDIFVNRAYWKKGGKAKNKIKFKGTYHWWCPWTVMMFGDYKNKLLKVHGVMCWHMIPNGIFNALHNHDNEPTLLLAKSFF